MQSSPLSRGCLPGGFVVAVNKRGRLLGAFHSSLCVRSCPKRETLLQTDRVMVKSGWAIANKAS